MMGMQISATISATVVAFPLGVLSDRIGRLPVLGASILSMILSESYAMFVCWKSDMIPLEAIWCVGVALLFGGSRNVAEAMLVGPVLSGELVRLSVWMPLFLSLGLVLGGGIILVSLTPETLKLKQPREEVGIRPYDYGLESNMLSLEPPKRTSVMVTFRSMVSRPLLWLIPGAAMTIPLATVQTDIAIRLMSIQFNWPLNRSILIVSLRSLVTLLTLSGEFIAILSWLPLHDDGNQGSLHHCRPSRVGTGLGSTYALPRHVSWGDRGGESRDAIRAAGGL
ncbi:major facilitator superfamily transporter [Fusarium mundagurra]|uniref:Major facilitator superfamily transporter n=1 Tax=Fusarium mundagurra TaxID=1567541 RepID=A0A8H5Y4Z3_9HYPO|nr:major facilitator superfamily transporter [Fusarium mundagurra]